MMVRVRVMTEEVKKRWSVFVLGGSAVLPLGLRYYMLNGII